MRLFANVLLMLAALAADAAAVPEPLAPYAGRIVYVDFWASWCGPCAESFPWLNAMQQKYGDDLTVVGVNVDTDAAAAAAFLQRHPARFAIVRDPAGQLAEHYGVAGMPASVILGRDGRVLHTHTGFRAREQAHYEAAIRDALRPGAAQGAQP